MNTNVDANSVINNGLTEENNYLCSSRDVILFGQYWQGIDEHYGKSALEWRVLYRGENGRMLVISKDVIGGRAYDTDGKDWRQTWEQCTLRKWLNESFINDAFSDQEQELIQEVSNENHDNAKFDAPGGNDTKDKIFLLSIDEVNKYFYIDEYYRDSIASATKYAKAQGVSVNRCDNSNWWLRTPGIERYGTYPQAAMVAVDGRIMPAGEVMEADYVGVRPAMWIDGSRL